MFFFPTEVWHQILYFGLLSAADVAAVSMTCRAAYDVCFGGAPGEVAEGAVKKERDFDRAQHRALMGPEFCLEKWPGPAGNLAAALGIRRGPGVFTVLETKQIFFSVDFGSASPGLFDAFESAGFSDKISNYGSRSILVRYALYGLMAGRVEASKALFQRFHDTLVRGLEFDLGYLATTICNNGREDIIDDLLSWPVSKPHRIKMISSLLRASIHNNNQPLFDKIVEEHMADVSETSFCALIMKALKNGTQYMAAVLLRIKTSDYQLNKANDDRISVLFNYCRRARGNEWWGIVCDLLPLCLLLTLTRFARSGEKPSRKSKPISLYLGLFKELVKRYSRGQDIVQVKAALDRIFLDSDMVLSVYYKTAIDHGLADLCLDYLELSPPRGLSRVRADINGHLIEFACVADALFTEALSPDSEPTDFSPESEKGKEPSESDEPTVAHRLARIVKAFESGMAPPLEVRQILFSKVLEVRRPHLLSWAIEYYSAE